MAQQAVIPLREQSCPDHEKGKICMVCKDCDFRMVCVTCIATTHQRHGFIEIEEFVKMKKDSLQVILTEVKNLRKDLETRLQKTKEVDEKSSTNVETIKSQLTEKAETMKLLIEKWLTERHEECDKVYTDHNKTIEDTKKKLTDQLNDLLSVITRSEIALKSTSYEDVTSLEEALSPYTADVVIPTLPVVQEFELWTATEVDMNSALGTLLTIGVDLDLQEKIVLKEVFKTDPTLRKGDLDGIPVTIKRYNTNTSTKNISKIDFFRQAQIMRLFHHPNVIKFHGVIKSDNQTTLVMEDMSQGFLLDFLQEKGLSLSLLLDFSRQVASGMEHVASKGYIHRHLSAHTILMVNNTTVKVAQFDLAVKLKEDGKWLGPEGTVIKTKWTAIEATEERIFSVAADVWSFGVLVWEMMSHGGTPYEGMKNFEAAAKVADGYRMPRPQQCPENIYKVLLECWNKDPKQRPTFEELGETLKDIIRAKSTENTASIVSEPDLKVDEKSNISKPPAVDTIQSQATKKEPATKKKPFIKKLLR